MLSIVVFIIHRIERWLKNTEFLEVRLIVADVKRNSGYRNAAFLVLFFRKPNRGTGTAADNNLKVRHSVT